MGESFGNFKVGHDEEIMPLITSANVGCGYHGGDPVTMARAVGWAILDLDKNLYWFMPVPNRAAEVADSMGVKVVGEMYVDMDYGPDGGLLVRREQFMHQPDPKATAERLVRYLESGKVRTT